MSSGLRKKLIGEQSLAAHSSTAWYNFLALATCQANNSDRDCCYPDSDGAIDISRRIFGMSRYSQPRLAISWLNWPKNAAATFATQVEIAHLSQLRGGHNRCDQTQPFPDFRDRIRNSATFVIRAKTVRRKKTLLAAFAIEEKLVRLSRPKLRRCDQKKNISCGFRDRGGNGSTLATKAETADQEKTFIMVSATEVETVRLSRPKRVQRGFGDRGVDGATFATKAATAWLFWPRRRRLNFPEQGGDGGTTLTKSETARFSRSR